MSREPTVPDFIGYKRPGIYLVILSEQGFLAQSVETDGKVWDDEDSGPRYYPDLARDAYEIASRHHDYIERIANEDPHD